METNNVEVKIRLDKVSVSDCKNAIMNYPKINKNDVSISYNGNTEINIQQKTITEFLVVTYNNHNGDIVFSCKVALLFYIENFDEIIHVSDDQKIKFDVDIFPDLISITIGAMRGVIAVKTKGTPLEIIPLPLIPANKIFEK